MKTVSILSIIILAGIIVSCGTSQATEIQQNSYARNMQPNTTSMEIAARIEGNNRFALDLYRQLSQLEGNIFFSPYSISAALSMTWAGAEGETLNEMTRVLHILLSREEAHEAFNGLDLELAEYSDRDSSFVLHVANALWGQRNYGFLESFIRTVSASYGAGLNLVDFSEDPDGCRDIINQWVAEQTQDRITQLIPDDVISAATRLVLTNAIYFKAVWMFPFEEAATRPATFNLLQGGEIQVPAMRITEHFQAVFTEDYMAAILPYRGERMAMLVLVPETGYFRQVEENLDAEFLKDLMEEMRPGNIDLALPRFETTSRFRLKEALSAMGMPSAFGMEADFSGMDGTGGLYISSVIHQAFISVDESGTEAAAATAVVMDKLNGESSIPFIVDRPFIYAIMDTETGTLLFLGRLLDPRGQ